MASCLMGKSHLYVFHEPRLDLDDAGIGKRAGTVVLVIVDVGGPLGCSLGRRFSSLCGMGSGGLWTLRRRLRIAGLTGPPRCLAVVASLRSLIRCLRARETKGFIHFISSSARGGPAIQRHIQARLWSARSAFLLLLFRAAPASRHLGRNFYKFPLRLHLNEVLPSVLIRQHPAVRCPALRLCVGRGDMGLTTDSSRQAFSRGHPWRAADLRMRQLMPIFTA